MTSHDAQPCGFDREELQRSFDEEQGARDVAAHVSGCDPCSSALELLRAQRDAVQYLAGTAAGALPETAVGSILARSARAGRERLADLLYELAKACLIVLPDLERRIERLEEPREAPLVAGELGTLNSRLKGVAEGIDLDRVPRETPPEPRALAAARSCLAILENVEGDSERQRLAWSQVLIFEGRPAEAETVLRELLDSGRPLVYRHLAQRNVMLALINQRSFASAVEFGNQALSEAPDDCVVLYNLAASHAWLKDVSQFKAASGRLSKQLSAGVPTWLLELIRYEIPNFADALELSPAVVEQSFGLSPATGGSS